MKKLSTIVLALVLFALPVLTFAQINNIPVPNGGPGGNVSNINDFIIYVINILLGIVGFVALLFLIIGGFRYITSAGNEESAGQAKKIITNAIIGIVIVILAFVIVRVIITSFA